jgi:hypothetical protein
VRYLLVFAVIASGILALTSTFAADAQAPVSAPKPGPSEAASKGLRSKSLSFDDSVVEGLNQNSKDSLEMVEKRDGRNRQHLYQKRADFKPEIKQFPSEMGYSP